MAEAEDKRPASLLERAAGRLEEKRAREASSGGKGKAEKAAVPDDETGGEKAHLARRRRLLERAAEQLRLQQESKRQGESAPAASQDGTGSPLVADRAAENVGKGGGATAAPSSSSGPAAAAGASARRQSSKRSRYQELDVDRLRRLGFITPDGAPGKTSEEFRIIKRPLLLNAFAKGKHRIPNGNLVLITSCRPGDGKTFCAINLALSIALEQDVRVLLIDADFPKPEALRTLGITASKGLMDAVLDPNTDLADCMIRTNVRNLTVLPAGRQHNLTPELLTSERMENLLSEISQRYPDRIVLFDSAPVLASSVASALAMHTGQTALVVEAEHTTEQQIREALGMITNCRHIGFILNKVRFLGPDRRFGAYYGYAYGR